MGAGGTIDVSMREMNNNGQVTLLTPCSRVDLKLSLLEVKNAEQESGF